MSEIRTFKDLGAWRVGMDVVELTYRLTAEFPDHERFGLVSQMRRAAVSVPSNIAEGQGVNRSRWTLRFIVTAIGSTGELETQVSLALRLCFCSEQQARDLLRGLDRVQKLLYGMKRERERRLVAGGALVSLSLFAMVRLLT